MSTNLAVGTSTLEEILCTRMTNTIVFPNGTVVTKNEANRPMFSGLKGIKLNVDALPWETLYILQYGVTATL